MKYRITALLLCLLLLGFTACGPAETSSDGGPSSAVTATDGVLLTQRVKAESAHTPVAPENYYQFSFLGANEKEAYTRMCRAIEGGKSLVDVSGLNIPQDRSARVTQAVIADNPQFFYLAKTISYTYNPETNALMEYQLLYTDGNAEDAFNAGTLVHNADKSLIDSQILAFNEKVNRFLASLPSDASAAEKEKRIHDYIVENVEYDTAAAETGASAPVLPRAYNAYGALCEGKATCEGYTKLFQYLCYCAGIRGTQVSGDADGGPHMWSAAEIDGTWYLVDVTWDDPVGGNRDFPVYSYYNLTAALMNRDHTPRASTLTVPECTSEDLLYYKTYALYTNGSGAPVNYPEVLDRVAKTGENYLSLYVGNLQREVKDYVGEQFFTEGAAILEYIREKGYPIAFKPTYVIVGDYIYLSFER